MSTDQAVRVRVSAETTAYVQRMTAGSRATEQLTRSVSELDRKLGSVDRRDLDIRARLDTSAVDRELRRSGVRHGGVRPAR